MLPVVGRVKKGVIQPRVLQSSFAGARKKMGHFGWEALVGCILGSGGVIGL